jgi:hypothetical protein
MDKHRWTLRRTFERRNHRSQHVVVSVLDGREVVLATGHCCGSCEKVKGKFDGDHPVLAVSS